MSMRVTISTFTVLLFFASSCSTVKTGKSNSGSQKKTYSEDLASYRPKPFVAEEQPVDTLSQLTITSSDSLDELLDRVSGSILGLRMVEMV